jgi:hypothetical protein
MNIAFKKVPLRNETALGTARVSRAGDRVLAFADFSCAARFANISG